jgi:sucrose phosphorylase
VPGVQLIAYVDRFGGTLAALSRLLDGPLHGLFGGVHVLPFYETYDGVDAGFDPIDHLRVDPRVGDWDVRRLSRSVEVVADLVVNHVSDRSAPFRDVLAHGADSPYAGMFLTYDAVFPGGATEADLLRVIRPRPGLPFTPVTLGGRPHLAWTTFTPHQIDLDVRAPVARRYLSDVLSRLATGGVTTVRLDAIGYAVKTLGTTCFLTPETFRFVDSLTAEAHGRGLRTLAEVHAAPAYNASTARHVDLVYDFVLAPLILHAVFTGDGGPLRDWLSRRPPNCVTVLETHDGIGLVDAGSGGESAVAGPLSPSQLDALVTAMDHNSGGTSRASWSRMAACIRSAARRTTRSAETTRGIS